MEEALALFRLIQGKDVFEAFYKKDLARRLLTGRSASEDAERRMLALLKEECGAQFTTKLEGMFKDMDLSRELIALAKKAPEFNRAAPKGVDVSVSVLTSGHWPSYPPVEVALPGELVRAQEAFQEFYLSKHSGRSLAWVPSQGTCTIKVQFNRGAKELVVSQLQAVVLLAFEGTDRLSFADLREQVTALLGCLGESACPNPLPCTKGRVTDLLSLARADGNAGRGAEACADEPGHRQ